MIIFIDESGDPGFKINRGASRYFVLAALVIEDRKTIASICSDKKLKKISCKGEIKFSKTNKKLVKDALRILCKYPIKIYTLTLDKNVMSDSRRYPQWLVYNHLLFLLIKSCSSPNNSSVEIRMDGSKNKKLVSNLQVLLRKNLNLKVNMKMVNSRNDLLIQLVDLIAGSIRRSYYEEKRDSLQYRNIIQFKIVKETEVKKLDLVSILEPV